MPGPTKISARTRKPPKKEPVLKSPVKAKADAKAAARKTYGPRVGTEPPLPKTRGPRIKAKAKTKTISAKKSANILKRRAKVEAGKAYKGQSSKKAVARATKKVQKRQTAKRGGAVSKKTATKQARRIVRGRKAKASKK